MRFGRHTEMASAAPCCLFLCESCGLPNSLPLDMIRQRIRDRGVQPNDYPAVAYVCPNCMHMQIRSLDPGSPYYQKSDTLVWMDRTEDATFLVWLPTCAENCEFLIPAFAMWNLSTHRQANEKWERDRPKEVNLKCPDGHLTHWNWS